MTTTRFCLYARTSTEDMQDPASSLQWQRQRAESILPAGAKIVRTFHDVGQSRSLPWKRRPEATALLQALKDPKRGFSAVVVGEPSRAFSGPEFSLIFDVFKHYDIELWCPEIGGRVDPASEAHDMLMVMFGGMSKGERMRIKTRVRSAMAAQAKHEARHLGGRPPFGYLLADAGPHPNASKAALGQRLHRLEPDPTAAPIVRRIFEQYAAGDGIGSIAEGLNADRIPSPSGHDPARNRHRSSANGAWAKSAIRAILQNPKYTGHSVWNRQPREEKLLDPDEPSQGHQSKQRPSDPSDWIFSSGQTHEAIISPELFEAVAQQRRVAAQRNTPTRPLTKRTYCLSSLVYCGICNRRMSGSWNHDEAHYRCGFKSEYAGATSKHPNWVYLRESTVTAALDGWLLSVFDPKNLDGAVAALAAAQAPDDAAAARVEAARRKIVDCDAKLKKYRTALEHGTPADIVAGWIKEVEADRFVAERELASTASTAQPLSETEIRALVKSQRKILQTLSRATPEQRASIYREMLGLRLTYHPEDDSLDVEASPDACTRVRVGGGT